jgi:RHH-type transcriptional regulator, proline utilization regulon repressor / proline dehydrogenase / delta 1-pyrroline-5-carboxylate dehydrogenase
MWRLTKHTIPLKYRLSHIRLELVLMSLQQLRQAIAPWIRLAEPYLLEQLLPAARLHRDERAAILNTGRALVTSVRTAQSGGWVEQFLRQYRLDTQEGIALLSLAEAFLRVPDSRTADALIRDKLRSADWKAHSGQSDSFMVNSATWGLVLGQALVDDEKDSSKLRRLLARSGEPFVRQAVAAAMRFMGEQFVLGRNISEALKESRCDQNRSYRYSFDMLGEGARTRTDALRYFDSYLDAVRIAGAAMDPAEAMVARNSISVKLSALHPRYEFANADACIAELSAKMIELCAIAKHYGIGVTLDAEESERLEISLDIIERVARAPSLRGWEGLGMAVQAYQKRATKVLHWVAGLGAETNRIITVRLVKGAYWDSEIKRTQERGLADYPVFTRKAATDISYLACAKIMLAAKHIYPAFASHNALTVATVMQWVENRRDFEFQRLHGMGEGLYDRLIAEHDLAVRVYAPVGGYRDLLAYLVRRLLENGANSSFVHQIADTDVPIDDLLEDPVDASERGGLRAHRNIPLPQNLFGKERKNSMGLDLADAAVVKQLQADTQKIWTQSHLAAPLIDGVRKTGTTLPVLSPADSTVVVGHAILASPQHVPEALTIACAAQSNWDATPIADRAACLDRLADLLETDMPAMIALCIREAGKTMADAVAEVREAVDFCRYYAVQARTTLGEKILPGPTGEANRLRSQGRGVFACISPWNFPLAIYIGQISAALVAGNAVIAKPAPQTPLIAARTADLILQSGIPTNVFHFLPGGPDVGAAIVADLRVNGVAFTGSTATARRIARTLLDNDSRPLVPLLAETGGINAMIVDSTALLEQVVNDVLISAFQSAGQRCSALRLLLLQDDIAAHVIEMLKGAMDEMSIGDPALLRTDVPPVIDAAARDNLIAHIKNSGGTLLHQTILSALCASGTYVPPTLIQLSNIRTLTREAFGPVLHVVTWKSGALETTIDEVNALGYGLTMGLHSRLQSTVDLVKARAKVGNLYVNRSMIGAVVGVQPFGGEGLSGTGPKAGGPHYLHRFCLERTVSIDVTSAGGNTTLLSLAD